MVYADWYEIENEIWLATVWDETKKTLTSSEHAYVDHLHRVYHDEQTPLQPFTARNRVVNT